MKTDRTFTNGRSFTVDEFIKDVIEPKRKEILTKEYNKLCLLYPVGMRTIFSSGLDGYIYSRTYGNYSIDAIIQSAEKLK